MPETLAEYGIEPAEFEQIQDRDDKMIGFRHSVQEQVMLEEVKKHYCLATSSQFYRNCLHQVHSKLKSRNNSGR